LSKILSRRGCKNGKNDKKKSPPEGRGNLSLKGIFGARKGAGTSGKNETAEKKGERTIRWGEKEQCHLNVERRSPGPLISCGRGCLFRGDLNIQDKVVLVFFGKDLLRRYVFSPHTTWRGWWKISHPEHETAPTPDKKIRREGGGKKRDNVHMGENCP